MRQPTEMEERVARAIGTSLYGHVNQDTPNTWGASLEAARAAIRTLDHLTLDMLRAANIRGQRQRQQFMEAWRRVIAAASPPENPQ